MLNTAGLVFDGRLVIDENFQTCDPCIFSAGPMSKYKRSLFANHMRHENYASVEIGQLVARKFMDQSSPKKSSANAKKKSYTIPRTTHVFVKPKVYYWTLLNGYYLLKILMPGPEIPHELEKSMEDYVIVDVFLIF